MVVEAQREPPQRAKDLLLVAPERLNVPRANPKQSLNEFLAMESARPGRSIQGPGSCLWGGGMKNQEERDEGRKEILKK